MDIARPAEVKNRRRRRRILYWGAGVAVILLVTLGLSRLESAAPRVERATVWTDVVKRGNMLRQVRGLGTLVPEEIRWIPAATDGRVERIVIYPGTEVTADSVILELSNPELEMSAEEAEAELRSAEAQFVELKVRLQSQLLDQRAAAAAVESAYNQARLQLEADEVLAEQGLLASLQLNMSRVAAEELGERNQLEQERLGIAGEAIAAQLDVQQAQVEKIRALARLRRIQVDDLRVRAGIDGMLQQVPVEVGQQVAPGTNLARVARPDELKAELRIPETQAKDVQIGQRVTVDTRNGEVEGRVKRVDPAVQNGTVTVDVELTGELPKGARPDLSVDGIVELERLENVLYVGRPAQGQGESEVGLFRMVKGSDEARRTRVSLGRASVSTIEVLDGLEEGDEVILSDTTAWDSFDRIRVN
jgi:HlyD family secretion protein